MLAAGDARLPSPHPIYALLGIAARKHPNAPAQRLGRSLFSPFTRPLPSRCTDCICPAVAEALAGTAIPLRTRHIPAPWPLAEPTVEGAAAPVVSAPPWRGAHAGAEPNDKAIAATPLGCAASLSHLYHHIRSDHGKPRESVGRKATGLRPEISGYGRRAAGRTQHLRSVVRVARPPDVLAWEVLR
jgi:hypothetical protein